MEPWEIVAEQEKADLRARYKLVLLRSKNPMEPYKVYGLERTNGYWDLVDKFNLPGSVGSEYVDWAFEQAWPRFTPRGQVSSRPVLSR